MLYSLKKKSKNKTTKTGDSTFNKSYTEELKKKTPVKIKLSLKFIIKAPQHGEVAFISLLSASSED